jgi:integrase
VNDSTGAKRKRSRRRSSGEGSVYPFDGAWRGAVTWTDSDGAQHKRTVRGATSSEARQRLDKLRAEFRLGTIAPPGQTLTVGEYLRTWLDRYRVVVRPGSWRGAESHVRVYLVPALGRIGLAKLTAPDVERALASFLVTGRPDRPAKRTRGRQNKGGISAQTVSHIRATLRRALSDAVRDGLVVRNAGADARPPRVPHRAITYLSARDLHLLIDATADDPYGPIYALAASTGLRLGEVLALSWADVDDGNLTVRRSLSWTPTGWALSEPKTARSRRTLLLPLVARRALETQRTRQAFARRAAGSAWQDRDGLVFTDAAGRPLRPEYVSRDFGPARDAAGVPRVRFHDLRHSAATALLAEGVPLAVISKWLGHAGIAITAAAYAAVVPELDRDARDAMDRALG